MCPHQMAGRNGQNLPLADRTITGGRIAPHILSIFYWSKTIQHFQLCIFNISYRMSVCVCRYCQDFRHISARKSVGAVVVVARRLRRRAPSMQTRAVESQVHSTEITQRVIYLSHNSI